ncbi:eukaryotic translation initiation factor 2-alpha kinase 1-like [Ochlerotatus camptorhynchus]|uniref:eukaryotic translation initiation factor 2-alpha kinase 1-like n=1 Tax=Ochlerotatus camptorhynchus TaxID=644619 RepID=UPI0031DE1C0C
MDSDEDDESFGQDWDSLPTITKFDGVKSRDELSSVTRASTRLVDNGLQSRIAAKASTPVSLLVESLVQQLCALLEADPKRSKELYDTICDRLYAVNLIDETYSMGEFEMMRSQYQRALYQLVSVARGQNLPVVALENIWPLQPSVGLEWSRYHREFTEVDFIAGGGFGKVYKARNNLDGIVYAVKKITIRSTTIKNVLVHLAEVKTLASLNHINIVPYKAAWLEPLLAHGEEGRAKNGSGTGISTVDDEDEDDDDEVESEEEDERISGGVSFSFVSGYQSKSHRKRRSTLDDSLKRQDDTDDFSIQFEYSNGSKVEENNNQLAELEDARASLISLEESQPHVKLKWATLYIQMTLCHLTLREWLDDRNRFACFEEFYGNFLRSPRRDCTTSAIQKNSFCRQSSKLSSGGSSADSGPLASSGSSMPSPPQENKPSDNSPHHLDVITDVLQQLLNGLTYIHSRGIVHHDIKPSNIFVSVSDHDKSISIQLGDFGLACPLQSSHTGVGFGTPLYAAPEQLEGKCDPKSDIYSMGIILLELLIPFETDMERADMIKQVRKGQFSNDLDPEFADLLKNLLSTRPSRRHDTFALTEAVNCMKLNRDKVISHLKKSLSVQEEEIQALKTTIDQKNRQQEESQEDFSLLELRTSESLILKEQELIFKSLEIESKEQQLRYKDEELRTKDQEIHRLRELLKSYQERDGGGSGQEQ